MKIGIYLDTEGNHGGVHQYSIAILQALMEEENTHFEAIAICATRDWYDYCNQKNYDCYYTEKILSKKNAFYFLSSYVKAIILDEDILEIRRIHIDFVVFPSVTPNMLFVNKSICAIHDLMHRYAKGFPEMTSVYQYILRDILFRKIAKNASVVLVDSKLGKEHVQESYLKGKDDDRITVLPFIAPPYIYEAEDKASVEEIQEWNSIKNELPDDFFFYPAQFWKHKNHRHLIEAICIAKKTVPNIHLVLVGSQKNGYGEIISLIQKEKLESNISILGYVSNYSIVQLYKKAKGLFMPSYIGPTNIPQLEAFYLGCPVAVADVYAVREQVKDAALIFNPNDSNKIAEYMVELWNDKKLRKELIEKGYLWSNEWGMKQFTSRVREIIEKLEKDNKYENISCDSYAQ